MCFCVSVQLSFKNLLLANCFKVQVFYNICLLLFSGLDKIEFLQNHENQEIYRKSFEIIERFFGTDEEDEKLAPKVDENSQQYNFGSGPNPPVQNFELWYNYKFFSVKIWIVWRLFWSILAALAFVWLSYLVSFFTHNSFA